MFATWSSHAGPDAPAWQPWNSGRRGLRMGQNPWRSRRSASGTAITNAPAIIRCSCSTSSASGALRLRPGNVHSADGWRAFSNRSSRAIEAKFAHLLPRRRRLRHPNAIGYLEAERIKYAVRLPANRALAGAHRLFAQRPIGRPSLDVRRSYATSPIRPEAGRSPAASSRRSNGIRASCSCIRASASSSPTWRGRPKNVIAFYNERGTCEQWIKEGKGAIRWTRLSCRSFAANAVRLQLHALAYNLGNFLRTLATPEPIKDWSLTSLKEKLIKIGAKVVSHGRYVAFQMAEVAIPRNLFADILRLIAELRPPPVTSTA